MSTATSTPTAKALARFQVGYDDVELQDISSPEEVLAAARALRPLQRTSSGSSGSLFRLESILGKINDFAAIFALGKGADPRVTGAVWGSLKILLKLASTDNDSLGNVLKMLDELSLALPRFRSYEESLPMTPVLEKTLIDAYAEITLFCARAVRFLKSNPHRFLGQARWSEFDGDFEETIKRLRNLSQIIDQEANAIRLRAEAGRNVELVEALESLGRVSEPTKIEKIHHVPPLNSRTQFFGREKELTNMEEVLCKGTEDSPRCILLHGLGGEGKSRLALEFIARHQDEYHAIVWLSADDEVKVRQVLAEVAKQLELVAEDSTDNLQAQRKVMKWLTGLENKWLLVLDNLDEAHILDIVPLLGSNGSVLITSRDPTITFGTTSTQIQLNSLDVDSGTEAILKLLRKESAPSTEKAAARELAGALGGLPLAITQISGFIVQQKLSLTSFLSLYQRSATRIHKRGAPGHQNDHILSTVWTVAIQSLPAESCRFQSLLALLDPDKIHEDVLLTGIPHLQSDDFEFVVDELDFIDAKEPLLKQSLLQRDEHEASLSIHRLVQFVVLEGLSPQERTKVLDQAIVILSNGFDNSWKIVTTHQFENWGKCELRVPHVQSLLKRSQQFNIQSADPMGFAELIFRCAWYLYERELYTHATNLVTHGIKILNRADELSYASACTLRGLIELDILNTEKALEYFHEGLAIREKLLPADDAFIASSLNAISIAYTELGKMNEAIDAGNRAIQIRLDTKSDRIGNSYSNMSSTLLRVGNFDGAEEMLARCPSLKDFTDETFLRSGNPRFAGDMILLGRIRAKQNRMDEAVRLISKALAFRQQTHGDHLKSCDTMQVLAQTLQQNADYRAAITFWDKSESIATNLPEAEAYVVRARYHLAQCYGLVGEQDIGKVWRDSADEAHIRYMESRGRSRALPTDLNGIYDSEVAWMLW